MPPGVARETVHVRENAQQFAVTYHDFAGYRGLYHHHGRNWILWTRDGRHVFVARGPEARARTWAYARFVLRHFIVARFLRRPGFRRIHAVAGALPGGGALVVAGPYLSGKTFLLEGLIAAGIAIEIVEDDCTVLSPGWDVNCLIPAESELRRTRRLPVRALVCLDRAAPAIVALAPAAAARWAMAIQASWPLPWLPEAGEIATTPGPCPPISAACARPSAPPWPRSPPRSPNSWPDALVTTYIVQGVSPLHPSVRTTSSHNPGRSGPGLPTRTRWRCSLLSPATPSRPMPRASWR